MSEFLGFDGFVDLEEALTESVQVPGMAALFFSRAELDYWRKGNGQDDSLG